jgi:hypothetical protein
VNKSIGGAPTQDVYAPVLDIKKASTSIEEDLAGLSSKYVILTLFALLEALAGNVLSQGVWQLSAFHAKAIAMEAGVAEEQFEEVMVRFLAIQEATRRQNPMHSMF